MALTVTWYDEAQSIAYIHFTPGWTWDDFWAMNHSFNQLAATVEHPIVLIVDMSGAGMPSQFVPEFSKIAGVSDERPANLELTLVVGIGIMLETVTSLFGRLYKRAMAHVRFVPTLDAALNAVVLHRNSLPSA